jgi:hypothetical protein
MNSYEKCQLMILFRIAPLMILIPVCWMMASLTSGQSESSRPGVAQAASMPANAGFEEDADGNGMADKTPVRGGVRKKGFYRLMLSVRGLRQHLPGRCDLQSSSRTREQTAYLVYGRRVLCRRRHALRAF